MHRIALALALLAAPAQAQTAPGGRCDLTAYEHANYRGAQLRAQGDKAELDDQWDDRISSVIIRAGVWEFHEQPDFRGDHITLNPGRYAALAERWDDRVSSFRCVRPTR